MDPLITNGIDPALLRVLDKHGQERDSAPRRKRPAREKTPGEFDAESESEVESGAEANAEENHQEPDLDTPKHTLDDLA